MPHFFIQNFGCRASQADGAAIGTLLEAEGFSRGIRQQAELVVLNTCTVTSNADDDLRQAVRRLRRENPAARILVTGCYAQRAPEEIAALEGVRWVVGNSHKSEIPRLLRDLPPLDFHSQIAVGPISSHTEFLSAPVEDAAGRTRPNLKIQDGCNNRCTFCVIPSVRGVSRSAPASRVVADVARLALRYREVVLSGINLGRWGRDPGRPQTRLVHLLERILAETHLERLRLSSIEPMDWSDELLALVAGSGRIAPHVHAPLQSGCDATLKRMKRRYRTRHYATRLQTARRLMPDAAIGADVMVGFPGETDAEFEESRQFIAAMPFTYLHVFTYSERPGTPAAGAPGTVPIEVRKHRNAVLRHMAAAKNLEFRRSMIGRALSVVTLDESRAALTGNYLKVDLAGPREPNCLVTVRIGALTAGGLRESSPFAILAG